MIHRVDLKDYEDSFNWIKWSTWKADDEHRDCVQSGSSAAGKSNCWLRLTPGSFS